MLTAFSGFSDGYAQFINSILGSYYFVWAGSKVAPKHNFFVGIILAVIHAGIIGSLLTVAVIYQAKSSPLWWLILTSIIGVVSTIVACVQLKEEDEIPKIKDV